MKRSLLGLCLCLFALSLTVAAQVSPPPSEETQSNRQQDITPRFLNPGDLQVLPEELIRESLSANSGTTEPSGAAGTTVPLCVIENQKIVGGCPGAGATTNIPAIIVPVVFNLNNGVLIFDPTKTDPGCLGSTNTALNLFLRSPMISAGHDFILDGENEGSTQYIDAFTRAQFSRIKAAGYNVVLNPVSVGPTLTVSVTGAPSTSGDAFNFSGQCGTNGAPTNAAGDLGVVNISVIQPQLQNYITAHAIPATTFTFFLLYNTVISNGDATNLNNCCILGFHTAFGASPNTYGIGEFEGRNGTLFSGVADVSVTSHEVGEWLDDPFGNNSVPPWGNIGQVSGCQGNLEVGDPLSGKLLPPVTLNGFTYHLQELAFFSWFTHDSPSLGAGGKYSDGGTFTSWAKPCPPGGTM